LPDAPEDGFCACTDDVCVDGYCKRSRKQRGSYCWRSDMKSADARRPSKKDAHAICRGCGLSALPPLAVTMSTVIPTPAKRQPGASGNLAWLLLLLNTVDPPFHMLPAYARAGNVNGLSRRWSVRFVVSGVRGRRWQEGCRQAAMRGRSCGRVVSRGGEQWKGRWATVELRMACR